MSFLLHCSFEVNSSMRHASTLHCRSDGKVDDLPPALMYAESKKLKSLAPHIHHGSSVLVMEFGGSTPKLFYQLRALKSDLTAVSLVLTVWSCLYGIDCLVFCSWLS